MSERSPVNARPDAAAEAAAFLAFLQADHDEAPHDDDGDSLDVDPAEALTFEPVKHGRPLTDLGNAERFADRNIGRALYCYPWGYWLVWDGRRWIQDDSGATEALAKLTVRQTYVEAAGTRVETERKALGKWALASETRYRIKAMLELAQSELAVTPKVLDANPLQLNVLNGTLDLTTGNLRPHHPGDLLTKLAPVSYDPDARYPLWDRFLAETTDDDPDLIRFLARCVGYSLTGNTSEEKLFFVHGPAAAGKSSFLEAVKAILGDYSTTADFETFLARSYVGGPRPDIARLAGIRMVASVEVAEGRRLAEGLVKLLTGGDTVTARFLYHGEFEFLPQFKLWLSANAAPVAKHDDLALWRRILKLPFDHTIPEDKRDPSVKARLKDPEMAGPAILAWAVQGCMDWQAIGLAIPERVEQATESYRLSQDPLREFIEECCVLDLDAWMSATELRGAYEAWGRENGISEKALVQGKRWGEGMRARGCEQVRQYVGERQVRGWKGIGLVPNESPQNTSASELPGFCGYRRDKQDR